jgi:hypothetical protein
VLIPVLVSFINILMNRIGGARNCVYPFQVRIGLAGHARRRVCATQGRGVLTRRLRRIWTVLECRRCWNIGGVGMCGWRCCPVFRHTVSGILCVFSSPAFFSTLLSVHVGDVVVPSFGTRYLVYYVYSRLPPPSQHSLLLSVHVGGGSGLGASDMGFCGRANTRARNL